MKTLIMMCVILLISGCARTPLEDSMMECSMTGDEVCEVQKIDPEKKKAALLIMEQIAKEVERLSNEQMKLRMILILIGNEVAEDEWIRAEREEEVDPKDLCRF
jgi:hypothetical protein